MVEVGTPFQILGRKLWLSIECTP